MYMVSRLVLTTLLLLQIWQPSAAGQSKSGNPPVVVLPRGPVSRIPSPNGMWTLIFECPNDCSERKLWIEENTSHTRKLVKEYERSLSISWAPDSRSFFVEDDFASNETLCYLYDATTLKETDIARVVLAAYPDAAQFVNAGHSYLEAKRWLNSHEVLVVLHGYNDGLPPRDFTLRYRIGLNRSVHKISQKVEE